MVRLFSRQGGGLAALKLTKLFGINEFPAAKDSGKVLIIIIYCYLIIIIIIIIIIVPRIKPLVLQCSRCHCGFYKVPVRLWSIASFHMTSLKFKLQNY